MKHFMSLRIITAIMILLIGNLFVLKAEDSGNFLYTDTGKKINVDDIDYIMHDGEDCATCTIVTLESEVYPDVMRIKFSPEVSGVSSPMEKGEGIIFSTNSIIVSSQSGSNSFRILNLEGVCIQTDYISKGLYPYPRQRNVLKACNFGR